MSTAISRKRATSAPAAESRHAAYVVCHESGKRYLVGKYKNRSEAEGLALWIGHNGVMHVVVESDDAADNAPHRFYSVAADKLVQVVTIDADGREHIACPCVPGVFASAFVKMFNRSPSTHRAVARPVVAVVVGGGV